MHMSGRSADKRTKASFISRPRPCEANSWVRAAVVRLRVREQATASSFSSFPVLPRLCAFPSSEQHFYNAGSIIDHDPPSPHDETNFPFRLTYNWSRRVPYEIARDFDNEIGQRQSRSGRVNRISRNNKRFTRKYRHAGANSSIYRYYVSIGQDNNLFLSFSSSSFSPPSSYSFFAVFLFRDILRVFA